MAKKKQQTHPRRAATRPTAKPTGAKRTGSKGARRPVAKPSAAKPPAARRPNTPRRSTRAGAVPATRRAAEDAAFHAATAALPPFLVVGVGASAGGYEAFSKLLHALPSD